MKKLIIKIFSMLILLSIIFVAVWIIPGNYPHGLASLANKIDTLESKKSPRMVFVGGSNLVHFKSPLLENELKVSVVNMGLWGGLCVKYILDEIKPHLKPGDSIIIISEYPIILFSFDKEPDEGAKKFFLIMSPEERISRYLEKGEYFTLFNNFFELCQLKSRAYLRNIITLNFSNFFVNGKINYHEQYNSNGDMITPFPDIRPLIGSNTAYTGSIEINKFSFLNDLYDFAAKRNAKVFLSFPPVPYEEYKLNEKIINTLYQDLKKYLKCPILNSPVDHIYPKEYFADTIYHLNEKGELSRAKKLIQELKIALDK